MPRRDNPSGSDMFQIIHLITFSLNYQMNILLPNYQLKITKNPEIESRTNILIF